MTEDKKPESYMLTVDLTPMVGAVLEEIQVQVEKETGKKPSKAKVIRDSLVGHYALDLYREPDRLLSLYEAQYVDPGEKKVQETSLQGSKHHMSGKATKRDKELVEAYVETYSLPNKKSVFWPPFLKNVRASLEQGLSYEDLEQLIRLSPEVPQVGKMIAENAGVALPMHQLFSEKMLSHLIAYSAARSDGELPDQELIRFRDGYLRDLKHQLGQQAAGEFWRRSQHARTINELKQLRQHMYNTHPHKTKLSAPAESSIKETV
jgi:hypothetical protein